MIKEIIVYTVICDRCGKDSCDNTGYSGWNDKVYALDQAYDGWFIEIDGKDYCEDCHYYDDEDNLKAKE